MTEPSETPPSIVDVLLVMHSGPLFYEHDIAAALTEARLTCVTVQSKALPQPLPASKLVMQLGLGPAPEPGLELLVTLSKLAPSLPLVVCSSHSSNTMGEVVRKRAGATFIHRPIGACPRFIGELVPLIHLLTA